MRIILSGMALRGAVLFVLALLALSACKKKSIGPTDAGADGSAEAHRDPPFECSPRPMACNMDVTPAPHVLPKLIRERVAAGKIEEATALVACAQNARIEPDPGLEHIAFSKDGAQLLAPLAENAVRVFDAKSARETMRIDDARHEGYASDSRTFLEGVVALQGNLLVVPAANARSRHGRAVAGSSKLWNLVEERELDLKAVLPDADVIGASDKGHFLWGTLAQALLVVNASALDKPAVRIALDRPTSGPVDVRELDGDRILVLYVANRGRGTIADAKTGTVERHFAARGELTLKTTAVLVFDQGPFIQGFDEPMFEPSHAPEVVAIDGTSPPVKLSAPGCTRSLALAASPDGTKLVTEARGSLCFFDLPSKKLLGTLPTSKYRGGMRLPRAAFVGNELAIVEGGDETLSIGSQALYRRIAIQPDATPALRDLGPIPKSTTLLAPFVGAAEGATARLYEVRPDGTLSDREVKIGFGDMGTAETAPIMSGTVITMADPKTTLLVGPTIGLGGVAMCPTAGLAPCVDLPLGGSFKASPDGKLLAGPVRRGPVQFTSPPFSYGTRGSLATVDLTNVTSRTHDAPGFRAATFGAKGELLLFGDDGVLLSCEKELDTCTVRARLPEAKVLFSQAGTIATFDGTLRANGEPVKVSIVEALASLADRIANAGVDGVVHTGRPVVVRTVSDGGLALDRLDGTPPSPITSRRCIVAIDSAGKKVACLSTDGIRVHAADTGDVLYEETWKASPNMMPTGAVAFTHDGTRLAYVSATTLAIVDLDAKKTITRKTMPAFKMGTVVAISPDGKRVVTALAEEQGDETRQKLLLIRADGSSEKIDLPAGTRFGENPLQLAIDSWGFILARWLDGGTVLVDPSRRVSKVIRSANDDGVWLAANGRVRPLGKVYASSDGIACRVGSSIVPSAACLPLFCDRPLNR